MTTNCDRIQAAILAALDDRDGFPSDVATHIDGCHSCAEFAKRHQELDAALASSLAPPSVGPMFRGRLRRGIRRDRTARWVEWLPEVMHVIACSVAVSIYVGLTPGAASEAVLSGLLASLVGYSAITIARTWFEETYS